jgi:hypothetical protein
MDSTQAVAIGRKVRVHFNLHTHLWSVTARDGAERGRVIAHEPAFALTNATFVVSEAGRQRVLREKCRAVHAWVEGFVAPVTELTPNAVGFTYNPYRSGSFTRRDTFAPLETAARVWFLDKQAFVEVN